MGSSAISSRGRGASARARAIRCTIARKLSALSGFYDYGVHDAEVLTHSPVASVRRPKVSDESHAIGLTAEELKRLLAAAGAHSPHSSALVSLLTFCGLRISEALGADVRDYGHDHGHRVLKVTRKGGKAARVALAPTVVRALDTYLDGRTEGPIFLSTNGHTRYGYQVAYEQLGRLCRSAGLPAGVTPHSLRHSYATESLRLGAALQDVQDALGHADPERLGATTAAATTSTAPRTTFSPPPSPEAPTISDVRGRSGLEAPGAGEAKERPADHSLDEQPTGRTRGR